MPKLSIAFVTAAAVSLALWGCSKQTTNPLGAEQPGNKTSAEHDHSSHSHGKASGATTNAEIAAELAKLPAEDKALAETQKICPVSGEPLGAMGAPIKVDVKGKPVFICCEGCKEELLAKPDEYIAKLQK